MSTTSPDPFEFPELDDAPIIALLNKSPDKMNNEELDALIESTQSFANNAAARRAASSGTKAKKKPAKSKVKLDLDAFI